MSWDWLHLFWVEILSGVFNYGGMSLLRIEDPTWHRMTLLGDFGLFEDYAMFDDQLGMNSDSPTQSDFVQIG